MMLRPIASCGVGAMLVVAVQAALSEKEARSGLPLESHCLFIWPYAEWQRKDVNLVRSPPTFA
jgi:hypothetical protein